jgi:hypothetical protein
VTAANEIRAWYVVIGASVIITIAVPLFEAGVLGVKLHFRDIVIGLAMIAAAVYELRALRRRTPPALNSTSK